MRILLLFIVVISNGSSLCSADDLAPEQRLVIACHRLNIYQVTKLLREGADVNARFNGNSRVHFQDPWSGGWPMDASSWTPLLALANSSRFPPPPKPYENTLEHLDWVEAEQKRVSEDEIASRSAKRVAILNVLLSHDCDIDITDNHGATALFDAICNRHTEFVRLLLLFSPNVNTSTGTYIDNTPGMTPLHAAVWSPKIRKLLLDHGANENAIDGRGKTAADYRRMQEEYSEASLKKRLDEFKSQIEALGR